MPQLPLEQQLAQDLAKREYKSSARFGTEEIARLARTEQLFFPEKSEGIFFHLGLRGEKESRHQFSTFLVEFKKDEERYEGTCVHYIFQGSDPTHPLVTDSSLEQQMVDEIKRTGTLSNETLKAIEQKEGLIQHVSKRIDFDDLVRRCIAANTYGVEEIAVYQGAKKVVGLIGIRREQPEYLLSIPICQLFTPTQKSAPIIQQAHAHIRKNKGRIPQTMLAAYVMAVIDEVEKN